MLTDQTVRELLDSFSASTPTPGGGSAAALSGALGASLLAMVAGMPKTKNGTPEDRAALDTARATLMSLQQTLTDLVDRDAAAYDLVVAAFKHPKATDEDKSKRKEAIQHATRVASEVPLETMHACSDALEAGRTVAEHGNTSAASDVAVATNLLTAGFTGAWLNVTTNLGGLTDHVVRDGLVDRAKGLMMGLSESAVAIYRSGGVADLFKQAMEYAPFHHGPARG